LVAPGANEPLLARGACEGWIGNEPIGENGFGYDPLFRVKELGGRSMAALTDDEKGAVSHRGNAVRQLHPMLVQLLDRLTLQVSVR
jgi:XTP/dITP diphosphohydrolase